MKKPDQIQNETPENFNNEILMNEFETEEEFTFNHRYFPEKGIVGGPK